MTLLPLTPEQQELVARNAQLAGFFARAALRKNPGLRRYSDDIRQVAALGLIRAAKLYDPERGAFSTLAGLCVRTEIQKFAPTVGGIPVPYMGKSYSVGSRALARAASKPLQSLDSCVVVDGHLTAFHETVAGKGEGRSDAVDAAEVVAAAMSKLSSRDQTILRLRYFRGMTLQQAGATVGIAKERVRQLECRAIRRVKVHLQELMKGETPA